MKPLVSLALAIVLTVTYLADGQGSFVYDQQSADENTYREGTTGIQQPMGQSFVPALSSVGFIRLFIYDGSPGDNAGGSVYLNLRANSIIGDILSSSTTNAIDSRFAGPVDFFFSTPVAVAPGITYFFQPVVQTGGGFGSLAANYNYPGGTAISQGVSQPGLDLWFREGVVVPEPQVWALLIVGTCLLAWRRDRRAL